MLREHKPHQRIAGSVCAKECVRFCVRVKCAYLVCTLLSDCESSALQSKRLSFFSYPASEKCPSAFLYRAFPHNDRTRWLWWRINYCLSLLDSCQDDRQLQLDHEDCQFDAEDVCCEVCLLPIASLGRCRGADWECGTWCLRSLEGEYFVMKLPSNNKLLLG